MDKGIPGWRLFLTVCLPTLVASIRCTARLLINWSWPGSLPLSGFNMFQPIGSIIGICDTPFGHIKTIQNLIFRSNPCWIIRNHPQAFHGFPSPGHLGFARLQRALCTSADPTPHENIGLHMEAQNEQSPNQILKGRSWSSISIYYVALYHQWEGITLLKLAALPTLPVGDVIMPWGTHRISWVMGVPC